jgi:hypothetical protein
MKKILSVVLSFLFVSIATAQLSDVREILNKSVAATSSMKGCVYIMKGTERVPNKSTFIKLEMLSKVNTSPLKIYSKVLADPNKGTELLYAKGERGDKVKVNPGKFLPTLNLAYNSSLLTKDQHHTLLSSGFSFFARLIKDGMAEADAQKRFNEVFKLEGEVTFEGVKCYKVIITDPTYGYKDAVGQANDNLHTFCQRNLVPEIKVMELNPWIKNFETSLAGKTIKVPTSYAKKSTIYINQTNFYPIFQEMYDDKGLYERYEYSGLKVNPVFKADEFTEDFSEYNF